MSEQTLSLEERLTQALQGHDQLDDVLSVIAEHDRERERYNGWTNYATWGVALVLSNDHGTYNAYCERLAELKTEAPERRNVPEIWTEEQAVRYEFADYLKDLTEELCGFGADELGIPEPSMMAHQLIQAGLSDVEWQEIADNFASES